MPGESDGCRTPDQSSLVNRRQFRLADLKFYPVRHDHKAFLEKASKRRRFNKTFEVLEFKFGVAHKLAAADHKL